MKELAICIPTYNSNEMLNELFLRSMNCFRDLGWDVYIYDSSENDEICDLVSEFKKIYDNLEYIRIDSNIKSNEKVFMAFQDISQKNMHEYIWICPDYIDLLYSGALRLKAKMREKYDYIVLNYRDNSEIGEKSYDNCNEVFRDLGWHITAYMASVIRIESFFKEIDWKYLKREYLDTKCIFHSHFAVIFEQMAKIRSLRAVHIPLYSTDMSASVLRKTNMWRKDTFYVWAECWPETVKKLPPIYRDKEKVIRDLGVKAQIFSKENFISMRMDGIYSREIYEKYSAEWKNLTDVKPRTRYKEFAMKYDKIYIYGCGAVASVYSRYLDDMGIQYEGFVVSDSGVEKDEFLNHKVVQINKEILDDEKIGIILGLNPANREQVQKKLDGLIDPQRLEWR